ncbi:hypothetical protein S40285_01762 [Stachybotrys chlorohalonatus IBT 40285]|uniref:Altered inheritance of mitochondria protein 19 n=1 Tax=Stachybotrys chlorohalonatus (strain IBT 40285) TaxID=1283841 RepID=A0A084R2C1_STAC4|nr:hypothetical protein S40285_01762 [Stachybotrys chlorohalonata IBT 40285]
MAAEPSAEPPKALLDKLHDWGSSSLPPSLLATLVTALHARPLQAFPLFLFAPPLLFSSYLNLLGFTTGSAGLTAAWSGLYALLALRRRQPLRARFSPRGIVRGAAVGLGFANAVAAGWVYATGDFKKDDEARRDRNRWAAEEDE